MGYALTINGYAADLEGQDAIDFEQSIADKAREFVAGLEGVTFASASFGHLDPVDLTEQPA